MDGSIHPDWDYLRNVPSVPLRVLVAAAMNVGERGINREPHFSKGEEGEPFKGKFFISAETDESYLHLLRLAIDNLKEGGAFHQFAEKLPAETDREQTEIPPHVFGAWVIGLPESLSGGNIPTEMRALAQERRPESSPVKGEPSGTERQKMLAMLLGMAIDGYAYDPQATRKPATGENKGSIAAALDSVGLSVDPDTIRKS